MARPDGPRYPPIEDSLVAPLLAHSCAYVTRSAGQGHDESAALANLALDADFAAVGQHQMLDDGEAQAGAAEVARAGVVDAIEALEQARVVLARNAGATVLDDQPHLL